MLYILLELYIYIFKDIESIGFGGIYNCNLFPKRYFIRLQAQY